MKVLIVTDAWHPQVNGVVTTLDNIGVKIDARGHQVEYLTPDNYKIKVPLPTYPEIKIALDVWRTGKLIRQAEADHIHIATEGTIGVSARVFCAKNDIPFTTSYHTKMPEYVHARAKWISEERVYKFLRWLHKPSSNILVTTPSMREELRENGFINDITVWGRGADTSVFNSSHRVRAINPPVKMLLYVGRVSKEKNLEAFLSHQIPKTRTVIVGDGPDREALERKYPHAEFVGYKQGEELAWWYANADVFVFPSKTDTFGIVMIEANACGTPVAAYPVTGPKDFVLNGFNGHTSPHLDVAIINAMHVNRKNCEQHANNNHTWAACAKILLDAAELSRSSNE